jgi:uncharacterized membrane protein YraQ (UPF0718 family)
MLGALLPTIAALAIGTWMALAGAAQPRVLSPLRSFALASVLVAIALHLLPEALARGGPGVLAVFAVGVLAPSMLGRLVAAVRGPGGDPHGALATALGVAGVLLHQVSDGVALGSVAGGDAHWDVSLAIAAHSVPLAAVMALTTSQRRGRRAAIAAAGAMAAAVLLGLALARGGDHVASSATPWTSAAVAGLLVHLLTHDVPAPPRTATARTIELAAIAVGIVLPLLVMLTGHGDAHGLDGHGHEHAIERAAAGEHFEATQAVVGILEVAAKLAGLALLALVGPPVTRRLVARLATGAAASRGRRRVVTVLATPLLMLCACDVAVATRVVSAGRARLALAMAAPELNLVTVGMTALLLGPTLAAIRVGAAIVIALVVALVLARSASTRTTAYPALGFDEHTLHTSAWLVAGLIAAGLLHVTLPPETLISTGSLAVDFSLGVAVGAAAYACAPAATPMVAVLVTRGLPPSVALAALLVGNAGSVLRWLRPGGTWRGYGTMLALVTPIALGAALLAYLVAPRALPVMGLGDAAHAHDPAQPWQLGLLAIFGGLIVRAWWRYGLAAWLEPLHRGEHHHHQHADGDPCTPDCHRDEPDAAVAAALPAALAATALTAPRTSALSHLRRNVRDTDHPGHDH